jgi:hypothetical protein
MPIAFLADAVLLVHPGSRPSIYHHHYRHGFIFLYERAGEYIVCGAVNKKKTTDCICSSLAGDY